jgi:hypothetical protein
MGAITGTTHIKTMFSASPGTGKHFIGNAPCSSDDSVTQQNYSLCFFTINNSLYKSPDETGQRREIWGGKRPGNRSPIFLSNDQEIPCPGNQELSERIYTLFPQGYDIKKCTPS